MGSWERWDPQALAERVLAGEELERECARAVLNSPDEGLEELLRATLTVREAHFGRRVKLCMLRNARSGICPEDCGYCSQSRLSTAEIPVYKLQSLASLLEGAERAAASGARRYCMVTSGRGPSAADIEHLGEACERIRACHPQLELCLSLGLTSREQAEALKAAGAGWINHNLNTSRNFYPSICTTHTWDDRVATIENVRAAGLNTCAGGIVGMGESIEDVLDLAYATRRMHIDSVPVNFLNPIAGTPLAGRHDLTPQQCLRTLCLFRLLNPGAEVRAAGGREVGLGQWQKYALYAANSIFVDGYLTTPGMALEETRHLIESLGFEVEPGVN
ncbi:MAG TPA: biotin synthase BioB [Candidatus Binataceae bacterium]|nr:biotin synthase BioB [Candidatus Binataceae bacterium]